MPLNYCSRESLLSNFCLLCLPGIWLRLLQPRNPGTYPGLRPNSSAASLPLPFSQRRSCLGKKCGCRLCRSRKGSLRPGGPRVNGLWQTRYKVALRDGGISLLPIDNLTWHNLFKGHPELAFDGFTYIKTYSITG
jgi:hypothetical protein